MAEFSVFSVQEAEDEILMFKHFLRELVTHLLVSQIYLVNIYVELLRFPVLLDLGLFLAINWIRMVHLEYAPSPRIGSSINVSKSHQLNVPFMPEHQSLLLGSLLEEYLLLGTVRLARKTDLIVGILFDTVNLTVYRLLDLSYFTSVIHQTIFFIFLVITPRSNIVDSIIVMITVIVPIKLITVHLELMLES